MNKKKRERLSRALVYLGSASEIIDDVADAEQDCYDNLPEGFQAAARGEKMEQTIDVLNEASELIGDAINLVEEAI